MTAGAELSSVATALHEITRQLTRIAESLAGTDRDDLAQLLVEVERALVTAGRRLDHVVDELA
ncbi:MAG: hypothetical protein ACRDZ9_03895 [Acidimicrobiales bacterium]